MYGIINENKVTVYFRILQVNKQISINIPINCYFSEMPDIDTLFPLCFGKCELEKFENI